MTKKNLSTGELILSNLVQIEVEAETVSRNLTPALCVIKNFWSTASAGLLADGATLVFVAEATPFDSRSNIPDTIFPKFFLFWSFVVTTDSLWSNHQLSSSLLLIHYS
jgi:hypothetical protein